MSENILQVDTKNKIDVISLIVTTHIIFFHTQYDQYYDKVKVNLFQNFLTPPRDRRVEPFEDN